MKKKYIVSIIVVLIIVLVILTNLGIRNFRIIPEFPPKPVVSLEEIKEKIVDTKEIYVCKDWYSKTTICSESKIVKIVDDSELVKRIVDTTVSAEEMEVTSTTGMNDLYSMYFINEKGKVIVSAQIGLGYCITPKKTIYCFNYTLADELGELMEIDIPER